MLIHNTVGIFPLVFYHGQRVDNDLYLIFIGLEESIQ